MKKFFIFLIVWVLCATTNLAETKIDTKETIKKQATTSQLKNKNQKNSQEEINALKNQIEQEKDNIKKLKLEIQLKIKEISIKAKEIQLNWNSNTDKISIQQAIQDSITIRNETIQIIENFENLIKENENKIEEIYNEKFLLSDNGKERGQWETEKEYHLRLERNKELENKKQELIYENKSKILNEMIKTLNPFITKLQFFQIGNFYDETAKNATLVSMSDINIDEQYFMLNINYENEDYSLKYDFSDIGREKAKKMYQAQNQFTIEPLFSVIKEETTIETETEEIISEFKILEAFNINGNRYGVEEVDITDNKDDSIKEIYCSDFNKKEKNFHVNFQYANRQYDIVFDFSNIKTKEAKEMYEKAKFDIKPIFYYKRQTQTQTQGNIKTKQYELSAFKIKHSDIEKEKIIELQIKLEEFPEIKKVKIYKEYDDKFKIIKKHNNKLKADIKKLKEDVKLKKYTILIKKLTNIVYLPDYKKLEKFDIFNNFVDNFDTNKIIISIYGVLGVRRDGTAVGLSENWKNIVSISGNDIVSISGEDYVGLKKDGTVVACGDNNYGQCNVKNWKDIIAISAGENHTVGLKKDGTVVACGDNTMGWGKCNVKGWKNIVAIAASNFNTVGLKKDGTVVAIGNHEYGICDVEDWKNILAISSTPYHTIGLCKDGNILFVGYNNLDISNSISNWSVKIPNFE